MSWQTIKQKLSHAFAVDPPGPAEPTRAQQLVIERVCRMIVRRHLTTPTLAFLQLSQPLNYVGSQFLHFFLPILSGVFDVRRVRHFASFLEHRGSIEYICRRLEALEDEATARERAAGEDPSSDTTNHSSMTNDETRMSNE